MIGIAKPLIEEDEIEAVVGVLRSGNLTQGEKAKEFEVQFSSYIGASHGVACSSGTSALQVGLEAAGIGTGDEVITTPFTFIATSNAILYNRAMPVFADIDAETFNIDPASIKKRLTRKTKAVLVVHLYGLPCDIEPVKEICDQNGLLLIEDCAQAHGAEYDARKTGTFGELSTFSFYATKNMTTGEGGMILTDDGEMALKARTIANQGQAGRYEHVMIGYNYRMTDMQAALGLVQLKKLSMLNEARARNASFLSKNLEGIEWLNLPQVPPKMKHVWHQFTVKVPEKTRDGFVDYLNKNGIGARIYYPTPVHLQPAYKSLGLRFDPCPVAESVSKKVVSLPVHPGLSREDLHKIVETVKRYR